MKKNLVIAVSLVLTSVVCSTCVRIELLNSEAGGILPRHEEGKWRIGSERGLRPYHDYLERVYRDEHSLAPNSPLPPEAMAAIEADVVKDAVSRRTNTRLRDVVSRWGLLQYALAPMALVSSFLMLSQRRDAWFRRLGGVLILLNGVSGVMMVYRGYFTSLGW